MIQNSGAWIQLLPYVFDLTNQAWTCPRSVPDVATCVSDTLITCTVKPPSPINPSPIKRHESPTSSEEYVELGCRKL